MPTILNFNNIDLQDIFASNSGNNTYGTYFQGAEKFDVGSGTANWNNSYTRTSNVNFDVNDKDFAAIFYPVYKDVTSNVTINIPTWVSKVAFVIQANGGNGGSGFTDYWIITTIPVHNQVNGFTSVQFSDRTSTRWSRNWSHNWSRAWAVPYSTKTSQQAVAYTQASQANYTNQAVFSQVGYNHSYQYVYFYKGGGVFPRWHNGWTFRNETLYKTVTTYQRVFAGTTYYHNASYYTNYGTAWARNTGTNYGKTYGKNYGTNYGRNYSHFYYANYTTNYTRSDQYSQAYSGSAGGGGGCIAGVYNIVSRGSTMTISYNFNNSYSNIIFNDTNNYVMAYNGGSASGNGNSGTQYYTDANSKNTSIDGSGGGGGTAYNGSNFSNLVTSNGSGGQTTSLGASGTSGGNSGISNNSTIQNNFLPTFDTNYGKGGNGSTGGGGGGSGGLIRYWFIK